MFKPLLPFFLLIPIWSQTTPVVPPAPPPPPECLTRPVTLGSVTLSCSLIETDPVNGASDFSASELRGGAPIFQVKISTSDPEVVAFRVGVTFLYVIGGVPTPFTLWGSVGKSPSSFAPPTPTPSPYYRYTFLLSSTVITGIEVQELKASSSQKF